MSIETVILVAAIGFSGGLMLAIALIWAVGHDH